VVSIVLDSGPVGIYGVIQLLGKLKNLCPSDSILK